MGIPILVGFCLLLGAVAGGAVYLLIRKPRFGVIVLLALVGVVAVVILNWKPIYKTRTPRFAEEVKKVMDPAELQQWAMAILGETAQSNSIVEIPTDRIPAGIRHLMSDGSPLQYVHCDAGSDQNRSVRLIWGGGFGWWGIRVGDSSFRASPEDENYYIEWKPGIYFWHETH